MDTEAEGAGRHPDVDPAEFVRSMMKISPEDAEKVRNSTPATPARTRRKNEGSKQEGPSADYGDVSEKN